MHKVEEHVNSQASRYSWELPRYALLVHENYLTLLHINRRSKACTEAVTNAMNLQWTHPTVICVYTYSHSYGYPSRAGSLPSVILTFMSFHLFIFVLWGENILHSCREILSHLPPYILTVQQHRIILHNKYHRCTNHTEVCQHPYPHARLQWVTVKAHCPCLMRLLPKV